METILRLVAVEMEPGPKKAMNFILGINFIHKSISITASYEILKLLLLRFMIVRLIYRLNVRRYSGIKGTLAYRQKELILP